MIDPKVGCIVSRAAPSTRKLEYLSTRCFLFSVENFQFGLQFFGNHLTSCRNSWKLGALRFHLQLASLEIDFNLCMLVQGPGTSGPR